MPNTGLRNVITGSTRSVEGVLLDIPTSLLPRIISEQTIDALIKLHGLLRSSAASVASNLGGESYRYLVLTMNTENLLAQMGHDFVPTHNPGD